MFLGCSNVGPDDDLIRLHSFNSENKLLEKPQRCNLYNIT